VTYLTPEQVERFVCPQPVSVRAGAQKYVDHRLLHFHLWGLLKTSSVRIRLQLTVKKTVSPSKTLGRVRKPMNRRTHVRTESGAGHFENFL